MRAAREIGRQPAVCYKVRERDADFAAAWDAIAAEWRERRSVARRLGPDVAVGFGAGAVALSPERDAKGHHRRRRDALTTVKRRAFLRALSETGTVAAACLAADVSDTAAYRLRGDDADFAAAWDRALRTAAPALEQVAWERAVEGWEETVYRGGEVVSTRRRYSETLLRQLIVKRDKAVAVSDDPKALRKRAVEAARAAGGWFEPKPPSRAEVDDKLRTMLARLAARQADAELRAAEEAGLFAGVPGSAEALPIEAAQTGEA